MSGGAYQQGGDATAISNVAKTHFGGSYSQMFEKHGWVLEDGQQYMHQASSRIKDTYGSVAAFEAHFLALEQASQNAAPVWTDDHSVLFTSFWGWTPETWGTIGWSGERGKTRRENLLTELTDPFICVCYVTSNKTYIDPDLKGMIAGFYLVSHERGNRDGFTHPIHHQRDPDKWQHSLRAIRAFSFLPEHRLTVPELDPSLLDRARSVSAMAEVLTDPALINRLRDTPWHEVDVYRPHSASPSDVSPAHNGAGFVPSGPDNSGGYEVSDRAKALPRQLYVLRLDGDTTAFLGRSVDGAHIYKIGLSVSPDTRRQSLQKSMPMGAFQWSVMNTTRRDGHEPYVQFAAAEAGEMAMKRFLAVNGEWLGGEFYLADDASILAAWDIGRQAAKTFEESEL